MQRKEIPIDVSTLPDQVVTDVQACADQWGISFDDACLRILVHHSRDLRDQPRQGFFARLFSNREVH